uniref:EF-hand domain-containing protein n=1 Tax=Neobodo designis TaxID=312471 RepID=A0A7S1KWJ2_NEODS|mmetsp:Transcript_10326/g.31952  ORF Transcript_10326/g.31952 Transcript_10326/m.31952 type:complete len:430 (+) Transcript_10326:242-1531(+)
MRSARGLAALQLGGMRTGLRCATSMPAATEPPRSASPRSTAHFATSPKPTPASSARTRGYDPELHGPETRGTFPHRVILSSAAQPSGGAGRGAMSSPELPVRGPPLEDRAPVTHSREPQMARAHEAAGSDDRCPWAPSEDAVRRVEVERRRAELVATARQMLDHSAGPQPGLSGSLFRCLVPLRVRELFATRKTMRCPDEAAAEQHGASLASSSFSNVDAATPRQPTAAVEAARAAESEAMRQLIAGLSPEARRYLLVAAATEEWYGPRRVGEELRRADSDDDTRISAKDYKNWVRHVFAERCGLSRREFALTALNTAIPFVAFGFLDNSVMILSGDAIDRTVGAALNLSAMAAAGLGGVCSGTMGIQVHGLAERAIQSLGFEPPPLSDAQRRHPSFLRATHVGGSIGIFLGLSLGMSPLLFLRDSPEE